MDNEARIVQLLESIDGNTRDIATWLSVAHGAQMREMLENVLDDPRKRLAYEYSDGDRSTRAVAEAADVSAKTIRDWWKEWVQTDIVEQTELEGRFRKRFSLRKLGIDVSPQTSADA